jgi:polyferredoxin
MSSQAEANLGSPDLVDLPVIGRFLRWRHARPALQLPLFLLAGLMVFDGLTGPQMAPKNLSTVLTWVHYRGIVVLALLLAGNLFCMACPFMLVRNVVRRFHSPEQMWPRWLRRKWLAIGLFVLMLFAYELFDLWADPRLTAWLIVAYLIGALVVDSLFQGAPFCKYLCPLGQFNFVSSLISPLEVKIRNPQPCNDCRTKDCIKGQSQGLPHGCELWLYQPRKFGNMDCTFCLDCMHACPHDNVGVSVRLPASELWAERWRSGIGRFSGRPDLAALVTAFCFGALLNAFAMVTPVYALEDWLAGVLNTQSELAVLAIIFMTGLVLGPIALLAAASWFSQRVSGGRVRSGNSTPARSLPAWMTRYAYALVPLGFGVWLAHYAFHFLTGFWTFVPVLQSFANEVTGTLLLGPPRWDLGPLLPAGWLYPLELGFLGLGWVGSLLVTYHLAAQDSAHHQYNEAQPSIGQQEGDAGQTLRILAPWAVLLTLLFAAAIWLMGQPMEMRGTFLVG